MIDIKGLDKAEVLAALFNGSVQQGMGVFDERGASGMNVDQAGEILRTQSNFDYLLGRVMKIDISGDEIDPWFYDRDRGQGAVEGIINSLRIKCNAKPKL